MKIPEPSRPSLSGYVQHGKLLPWNWVDERMKTSRNYWITTSSDGFPSSRPVWGIWNEARLLFSSGSLISKNIIANSMEQVNLESADELVIVEGLATPMARNDLTLWIEQYKHKYHWDMPESIEDVYEVKPVRVLAWICDSSGLDAGVIFSNTATQWQFEDTD